MIFTATMWVLPHALQGHGDREDWRMTIMRGPAADAEDFKRQCVAQQGPGDRVEFGPMSAKAV